MLINMMEHYVDERLSELLKDYNCCKCEVCLEDMKAFSLNRLPPKYVSTVNGQVFPLQAVADKITARTIDVAIVFNFLILIFPSVFGICLIITQIIRVRKVLRSLNFALHLFFWVVFS